MTFLGFVGIVLLWRAGPLVFPEVVPWRRPRPTLPDGDSESDPESNPESDSVAPTDDVSVAGDVDTR